MDGSYNNDQRIHNQLSPFDNSNTVNAIYTQINQLNNHFTNYQISNNKKIESIHHKVDFQFNVINEKLEGLSRKVNDLDRKISLDTTDGIQRNDEKVLEIFKNHINKLSNDIQELSTSLYTKDSMGPLASEKSNGGHIQNKNGVQRNNNTYRSEISPEAMAIDMDIDNRNRSWPKSLSLRSPAPQPNSAPSSPITNRYFDLGSTLEKTSIIGNDKGVNYANESHINVIENPSRVGLENVERMDTIPKVNKHKKSRPVQEIDNSSRQYDYSLMNSRPARGFQGTNEQFIPNSKRLGPNNNTENFTPGLIDGQNAKQSEYNDFENLNQINVTHRASIMSNQSRTLEIGPEIDIVPNSFGQALSISSEKRNIIALNPMKKTLRLEVKENSTKSINNIPGVTLLKGKKLSTTPQYKLEKSLRNVLEIWKEYEYGINGKPPLRVLEAQYSTKWRNETELRTFLRRKKIYDAIEKGKKVGYTERQVIDELELLRTYEKHGAMKKKPLLWLYSNIPRKFS